MHTMKHWSENFAQFAHVKGRLSEPCINCGLQTDKTREAGWFSTHSVIVIEIQPLASWCNQKSLMSPWLTGNVKWEESGSMMELKILQLLGNQQHKLILMLYCDGGKTTQDSFRQKHALTMRKQSPRTCLTQSQCNCALCVCIFNFYFNI